MKTLFALAIAIAVATAAQSPFYLMALRSASPIHFGAVQANGSALWIGKEAGDYCPPVLNLTCPNSTTTIYSIDEASGSLSLDVVVPGGQRVYVEPSCGKVQFTRPHSAYIPPGAITGGWKMGNIGPYSSLEWTTGANGTVFCPTGRDDGNSRSGTGPWEMYVTLPNVTLPSEKCLAGSLLAANATGAGAWEYL